MSKIFSLDIDNKSSFKPFKLFFVFKFLFFSVLLSILLISIFDIVILNSWSFFDKDLDDILLALNSSSNIFFPLIKNLLCFICSIFILLLGSVTNILFNKSFASSLIYFGYSTLHFNIFLNKFSLFFSSKGKYPHNIAYRIIPLDHISILNPSYFFPATL